MIMKILLIHQNFPGQFLHLAPALVRDGHEVHALVMKKEVPAEWNGVHMHSYMPTKGTAQGVHPWVLDMETKVIRAEAVFRKSLELKAAGFEPDVVIAHPGWGESLFIKDAWPQTRLGLYCEFNYNEHGQDVDFDPEFATHDPGDACRLRLKNLNNMMHFELADGAVSPTHFQADTFPYPFRTKIKVLHDGIDTTKIAPYPLARLQVSPGKLLGRTDEVITFANRNLEPYRGYHIFMRALPALLKARPRAQIVIVGGEGTSYGRRPPQGKTWKSVFLEEVRPQIDEQDWSRVHFLPNLPHDQFINFLQISRVHVYLTYPFVASWSLLEAMSAGCAIVGSDTEPVQEFIKDGENGLLTPFFEPQTLTDQVVRLLEDAPLREKLGQAARRKVQTYYDLEKVCLPRMVRWVDSLSPVRTPRLVHSRHFGQHAA
jgi:glycosyltransferase involved in cell wall biosynthesis